MESAPDHGIYWADQRNMHNMNGIKMVLNTPTILHSYCLEYVGPKYVYKL